MQYVTMIVTAGVMTRPADTTQYAVGDLVANDTTAANVVPLRFSPVITDMGGSMRIEAVRLAKSGTGTTNANFRLHIYDATPGTPSNGDNGAWLTGAIADYIGSFDITCDKVFTNGAYGYGLPTSGVPMTANPTPNTMSLFGLLEARGAYTPASGETFTVTLEGYAV